MEQKVKKIDPDGYFDYPAISRSDLILLEKSPARYRARKDGLTENVETKAFFIGHLVDCKLLTPDEFPYRYKMMPRDMKSPSSPQQVNFCEMVVGGISAPAAYSKCYSVKGKNDNDIEKLGNSLKTELNDYLNFTASIEGHTIFTAEQGDMLVEIEKRVAANPAATRFLDQSGFGLSGESQLALVARDVMGLDIKVMIDRMVVDDKNKIVYNIDLKTTASDLHDFWMSYRKYDYHVQQAMYGFVLKKYMETIGLGDYKMVTLVIAVEKSNLFECRVFSIQDKTIIEGMRRFKYLMEKMKWHIDEGVWTCTKWEHMQNHIVPLNWPYA